VRVQGWQKCESELRRSREEVLKFVREKRKMKEWTLNWQECGCQLPAVMLTCMPQLIRMPVRPLALQTCCPDLV